MPVGQTQLQLVIQKDGFNDNSLSLSPSEQIGTLNGTMTPKGRVYFLSKRTGTIDVMSSNLDGSNMRVVVPGTGNEDYGTQLVSNKNWRYSILYARRDDSEPKLYLLDENSSDKFSLIDEGTSVNFSFIGWVGDHFIYQVNRLGLRKEQPKKNALKDLDAAANKLSVFEETDALGGLYNYADEELSWVLLQNNEIIYKKSWGAGHTSCTQSFPELEGKQDSLHIYSPLTRTNKVLSSEKSTGGYPWGCAVTRITERAIPLSPQTIYIQRRLSDGGLRYFSYSNSRLNPDDSSARDYFEKPMPSERHSYYASPSGDYNMWAESRDGKNVFFIAKAGEENSPTELARLRDFRPYGWFSDDYILLSKNNSELYILSRNGARSEKDPLKITDYQGSYGYGGGYGG